MGPSMDAATYYRSHPPRCLAGFRVKPARLRGVTFDGHGEKLNTIFRLACSCGHEKAYVLGHYWRNPDYHNIEVFISPLALECNSCGKITELIDTGRHGYDSEFCSGSATKRGKGRRQRFRCEKCGPMPMQVHARFEYPGEIFGADGLVEEIAEEGGKDFRGREQDLFSWFTAVGKCSGCSKLLTIDFECA